MKKHVRHAHPSEADRRSGKVSKREGQWSFAHTSDILFALGATEETRRVAVRTPTGELRFLPR
jgi:hypothetical protein